ncbi:MAG: hypothetical protein WA964_12360 [Ilumatobacter sp.]|uniref:hypothetical protein n=1 Tax=Ilumatobacter sp. TaxID=1967498 RepID=UPI003C78B322
MLDDRTYADDTVRIDATTLTLPRYYFPTGRAKVVQLDDIVATEVRPVGWMTRWRLWGSSNLTNWLPLDFGRPKKQQAVVLDLGGRIRPTFTPDDPDRVVELLARR